MLVVIQAVHAGVNGLKIISILSREHVEIPTLYIPLIPIAIFLVLYWEGIPRTLVSKKGMQLSMSVVLLEADDVEGPQTDVLFSNFFRFAGGDFCTSSSSVSES